MPYLLGTVEGNVGRSGSGSGAGACRRDSLFGLEMLARVRRGSAVGCRSIRGLEVGSETGKTIGSRRDSEVSRSREDLCLRPDRERS